MFTKDRTLYLVTDREISGLPHREIARRAIDAGVRVIQMREKALPKRDIYREAVLLRELTSRHGVTFIINDYVDIALMVDADGVHLGQEDMPVREARQVLGRKKIIGVSTHTLKEALKAQEEGADYIGFGPIFGTTTKDAGRPKGLRALRRVREHTVMPIVAIGGITPDNARDVLSSGADAIAVISAILRGNIGANIERFISIIKKR